MQHDPQFTEWLRTAKVGDSYVLEAHPAKMESVVKAARTEAARHHVEITTTQAEDHLVLVEVSSLDPFACMHPKEHAAALFALVPKPTPGKTVWQVRYRPGQKHELLRELHRLYSRAGYDIFDGREEQRGSFQLWWRERFAHVRAEAPKSPLLQSPDDLEAKGLLRFDSKDLKTEPSGPQDGAGEFSAGGSR